MHNVVISDTPVMPVLLVFIFIGLCSCEPLSQADIYHTWFAGFEGAFYIRPPTDINQWVVHLIFDQPVRSVAVCVNFPWSVFLVVTILVHKIPRY